MLRTILMVSFIAASLIGYADSLKSVRKSFHRAILDPTKIPSYYELSKTLDDSTPILLAYKAMGEALIAQDSWNPISKLVHIRAFEKIITSAVHLDPDNLEIRFLRMCVEYHIPEWLRTCHHLSDDKNYIITNISRIGGYDFDKDFVKYISYFIKETKLYNRADEEVIVARLAIR